jgi:hypothetical protein
MAQPPRIGKRQENRFMPNGGGKSPQVMHEKLPKVCAEGELHLKHQITYHIIILAPDVNC